VQMQQEADATRAQEMASADLSMAVPEQTAPRQAAPQPFTPAPVQASSPRVPERVARTEIAPSTVQTAPPAAASPSQPSVALARAALSDALVATGTEDPALAGADYARPTMSTAAPAVAIERSPQPVVSSSPAPPPVSTAVSTQPAQSSGPWKIQLGAFSVRANAERLSAAMRTRPEIGGRSVSLVPAGNLTKVMVDGFASRATADAACDGLARAGQACVVTQ
jgi:uncharacterized protein